VAGVSKMILSRCFGTVVARAASHSQVAPWSDNGLADHALRIDAEVWEDTTPLVDENADDERSRQ